MRRGWRAGLIGAVFALGWLAHDLVGAMRPALGQATMSVTLASPSAADQPWAREIKTALIRMASDFEISYHSEVNKAFAEAMIPLLRASIAVSKTMLNHGSDGEMRQIAETIVGVQEKEVVHLLDWLTHRQ